MKLIPLTQGFEAIVDNTDKTWLTQWSWCILHGYAARSKTLMNNEGKRVHRTLYMHREIMAPLPGFDVDHINGNRLDNRRENLRICTHQQNLFNSKLSAANKSGYRGVSWDTNNRRWVVQIRLNGKPYYIGAFRDKHEAARAYNEHALKFRGEFAVLNTIWPDDLNDITTLIVNQ